MKKMGGKRFRKMREIYIEERLTVEEKNEVKMMKENIQEKMKRKISIKKKCNKEDDRRRWKKWKR